mgnify:CR=1 FL=1
MRKEQWSSGEPTGKGPEMATSPATPSAAMTPARKALGERERQVAPGRVAGQDDIGRVVARQAQPFVGVVAVVDRAGDRMLGDHPVVDDEHRAVGELGQFGDHPAVGVGATGQERPAVQVEDHRTLAVGGQHPGGADQLGRAVRQRDRGTHRARRRPQDAGGEVDETERPGQLRHVRSDCQSWLDRHHGYQSGEPARQASTVFDDLDRTPVADRKTPRLTRPSRAYRCMWGPGDPAWCRHRHHFLRRCSARWPISC